mgnify:CR=1 FL=1
MIFNGVDISGRTGYNERKIKARQTPEKVSKEGSEDMSAKCEKTYDIGLKDILGGGYKV